MLINELAKRVGVSVHTIRFYERSGLIAGQRDPHVTSNNYFHYDEACIERLELILEAKSVGFTLAEIAEIIDAWYGNIYTRKQKIAILEHKIEALDAKIRDLRDMKKQIRDCIDEL